MKIPIVGIVIVAVLVGGFGLYAGGPQGVVDFRQRMAVKSWLGENLNDPDSLQVIEWGPVRAEHSCDVIAVSYRAKNSFGGYETEVRDFRIRGWSAEEAR